MCWVQGARDAAAGADAAEPLVVPEDIGRAAAQLLLEEVSRGGVTDGTHQGLLLLMAALGPEEMNEVSRCRPGVCRKLLVSISAGGCCHWLADNAHNNRAAFALLG